MSNSYREQRRIVCPVCGSGHAQLTGLAHDGYRGDLSDLGAVTVTARCHKRHTFTIFVSVEGAWLNLGVQAAEQAGGR
jgi:hypothetical protein